MGIWTTLGSFFNLSSSVMNGRARCALGALQLVDVDICLSKAGRALHEMGWLEELVHVISWCHRGLQHSSSWSERSDVLLVVACEEVNLPVSISVLENQMITKPGKGDVLALKLGSICSKITLEKVWVLEGTNLWIDFSHAHGEDAVRLSSGVDKSDPALSKRIRRITSKR